MKSKSIVQERLEAGRNRYEIITREVESTRMSSKEVARGLRQVGGILEGIQKLVMTDTDVKFQQPINQKLESGMTLLTKTINALEGKGITGNNLTTNLKVFGRTLDSLQEFVDLEIESLS